MDGCAGTCLTLLLRSSRCLMPYFLFRADVVPCELEFHGTFGVERDKVIAVDAAHRFPFDAGVLFLLPPCQLC